MDLTLQKGEREAFLQRYFRELEDWRKNDLSLSREEQPSEADLKRFQRQIRRLSRWRQAYEDSLPRLVLGRCPFSRELFYHSFDPFGLDGLWWNFEAPVRPLEELLPSYFALTGAVCLGSSIESAPFLCKPGPGLPYVLPKLLKHPEIEAVIRELTVGPHRAFAVVYFARSFPPGLSPANEWGTDRAYLRTAGSVGWVSSIEQPADFDFDLRPWLEQGKLHWMAAEDPTESLHSGAKDCPYLDLAGERKLQRIEHGKVWTE